MKSKKDGVFYKRLAEEVQTAVRKRSLVGIMDLGGTIRRLRQEKKLTGVELCRQAGNLDPRTLTAVEKGRIKNPSLATLEAVSRGLGVTVSEIFRKAEGASGREEQDFYLGSQKGAYQIDFPAWGAKVVSFTPLVKDFFCGKIILGSRKRINQTLLRHPLPVFVSVLVGRFELVVEGRSLSLKEGENLFFNGILKHSFYNPLQRESVLLMVTAPSFL